MTSNGKTLRIFNGTLLAAPGTAPPINDAEVQVAGGRIVYAGLQADAPAFQAGEDLDATGKLVLPGLVNGHSHLCMIFGRTLGPEMSLLQWLDRQMPLIRAFDEETLYIAELLGCLENIRNGNTTLVENIFAPHPGDWAPEDAAFRAMRDSGIRGIVARGFTGRNFAPDFIETGEEQIERIGALAGTWKGAEDGRLGLFISPLLPWSMTAEHFADTRALADRHGLMIHQHVAESPEFNAKIEQVFERPLRNVELLQEMGCLGPDVQAVAVSDLNDREIEILAETDTRVIFDPQTRLFWGTGFPEIKKFLDAGLTCGLGSNGPAANCGQDLFESMKYACATAKTAAGDPQAMTRHRALRMATAEGATVLGLGDDIGRIEAGRRADIITVDLQQAHLMPTFDIEAALVYSARGADVRDSVIDGQLVMRDRKILSIDEAALLAEVRRAAASVAAKAGVDLEATPPLAAE